MVIYNVGPPRCRKVQITSEATQHCGDQNGMSCKRHVLAGVVHFEHDVMTVMHGDDVIPDYINFCYFAFCAIFQKLEKMAQKD
jgi:hypothetical protein